MANEVRASSAERKEERRETGRLEALSDGVFAVAVTLLIFGVTVPAPDALKPGTSLLTLMFGGLHWLRMVTYALSFLTILVMWVNHHSMFLHITHIDRPFVYLNGGLLMMIVFVNYPTALLADFAETSGAEAAAAIYSATLVTIAIFYNAMWFWAAAGKRLLASDVDQAELDRIAYQYRFGPLLYLAAFGLAFVNPWLSIALNAVLGVYWAFTGQVTQSRAKSATEHGAAGGYN